MRPWLLIPPKLAHDIAPLGLNCLTCFKPLKHWELEPFQWRKLTFHNRMGTAGGVDKNGTNIVAWWKLGAGFVEVGTVTPRPQKANPGKIIARLLPQQALWNQMGFPNNGVDALLTQLQRIIRPHFSPVFINIGKNRDTPLDQAAEDYRLLIQKLSDHADVFVINISSPNTKDLRQLQTSTYLNELLKRVQDVNSKQIPLLLKCSPDITIDQLEEILEISLKNDLSGWILTNTTTARENLPAHVPTHGGISGKPLANQSKRLLQHAITFLGQRKADKLIVSAGGVLSAEDILERHRLGADLVQIYSGLIITGPHIFIDSIKKNMR